MSKETKYVCDRCGHTQYEDNNQMWNIAVTCWHESHSRNAPWGSKEALWCRKCCETFHMLKFSTDENKDHVPAQPPSLEERIREIVKEEVGELV